MKKSTGVILVLIIVLLLGVIGVGSYFFIKGNNDTNKEIGELKNEVANLGKTTENTSNNTTTNDVQTNNTATSTTNQTTSSDTQSTKTMKDVAGEYRYETKDSNGETYTTRLLLVNDGTFGCLYDLGSETGSYSIDGNKITLNVLFYHGTGIGLEMVKTTKTLIITSEGTLITKDINPLGVNLKSQDDITMNKVSNATSDFDIRNNIRGSIGSGPEYHFKYNY